MIGFLIMVMAGWVIYLTIPEYTWLGQIFNMIGAFGATMCYQMTKERIKRLEDILHKNSTVLLRYKNYIAEIKYSDADGVFYGKVNLFKDLIMFESANIKEIKREFHRTIRDYIRFKKIKEEHEKVNQLENLAIYNATSRKKIRREFHKTIKNYIRLKKIREKHNFNHLNDKN